MAKELGFKFTGNISVMVDRILVQATLLLSKEGTEHWDELRLWKYLGDNGVKEAYDKDKISLLITEFQKSREMEKSQVIATGTLPDPAVPEEYEWMESLPLPEELKDVYERITKKNASPEVFQSKTERSGTEKKETQVKVVVSPKVISFSHVEAGTQLAEIRPPHPGRPGRDLEGRPLQPQLLKNQDFYLGSKIGRQKDTLIALESGFFRRGRDWADLLPYRKHFWSITLSPDRLNGWVQFEPGNAEAPPVTAAMIVAKAVAEGIPEERLLDTLNLERQLQRAIARKESLKDLSLTPDLDGSYHIDISLDKLRVTLTIQKSSGQGKQVTAAEILKDLGSSGFKGLDLDALKTQLDSFFSSQLFRLENHPVLSGKSPTRHKDRTLNFEVDYITSEEWNQIKERVENTPTLQKSIPEFQKYPLSLVSKAAEVQENQMIATFQNVEGGEGEVGLDVFGGKIPPYPGNDPMVHLLGPLRRDSNRITAGQEGLLQQWEERGEVFLRLSHHKSAGVAILRSSDNMEAFLSLTPSEGTGRPLTEALVKRTLEEEQILEGLDQSMISKCLQAALAGKRVLNVRVARGRPPGTDLLKRLQFFIPLKNNPALEAQGPLPWRGSVKEGEVIGDFDPPTAETLDGIDVMGNLVPADSAIPPSLNLEGSLNTILEEGSSRLKIVAEKSGELSFNGLSLHLKDRIILTGPISKSTKFPGAILIDGNVGSGIYIMAGGDLKIKGQVQGSLLSADNSIQISEGVKGEGKAVLRAKKHIAARYFEKSHIMSVGDTVIGNTSLACQIRCNGKVIQKGEKGTIAGGKIKTKFGIDAVNLGSPQGIPTSISFGQDYLVEDQITVEEKEIDKIRQGIIQLDVLMRDLVKIQAGEKLNAVRQKKVLLLKLLQKRGLRLINLKDRFEIHYPSEIMISGFLFPGVSIESHGRVFEVKTKKNALKLTFNQQTGHIEESPLG